MRICFSSSQMNAIGGFSARLNGFRRGHPSKMRRHEKQEQRNGLSGTGDFENRSLSRAARKPAGETGCVSYHAPADRLQHVGESCPVPRFGPTMTRASGLLMFRHRNPHSQCCRAHF
jgi:hypothetical protein